MNERRMHSRLMEGGRSWDEADAIVSQRAEDARDAEIDRRMLEYFEQLKHARALENFDGRD